MLIENLPGQALQGVTKHSWDTPASAITPLVMKVCFILSKPVSDETFFTYDYLIADSLP